LSDPPYVNPLMGTLKPQSNGPLYSNTVIGTLAAMGGLLHLVQRGGARVRVAALPSPILDIQPSHQRPVYQLHIIRCGTIIAFALYSRADSGSYSVTQDPRDQSPN